MLNNISVETDNAGRLLNYRVKNFEHYPIDPADMIGHVEGGETLRFQGQEFVITELGSLIHTSVELGPDVVLGAGVLIRKGSTFETAEDEIEEPEEVEEESDEHVEAGEEILGPYKPDEQKPNMKPVTIIGNGTLINETAVGPGVIVGEHSLIGARSIGARSRIGSHVILRSGVIVGENVKLADASKVDVDVPVGEGAEIGLGSKIGRGTYVGNDVMIGKNVRVGVFGGTANNNGSLRGGITLTPGRVILDNTVL